MSSLSIKIISFNTSVSFRHVLDWMIHRLVGCDDECFACLILCLILVYADEFNEIWQIDIVYRYRLKVSHKIFTFPKEDKKIEILISKVCIYFLYIYSWIQFHGFLPSFNFGSACFIVLIQNQILTHVSCYGLFFTPPSEISQFSKTTFFSTESFNSKGIPRKKIKKHNEFSKNAINSSIHSCVYFISYYSRLLAKNRTDRQFQIFPAFLSKNVH